MARRRRRPRRNPLAPPNLNKLLSGLGAYKPPADLDTQVENRLNLETAGATNAINRSRAMGQHMYQLQSQEARGWQQALVGMLTGGKTGDEAMKYSKENFGGSYLAGIAMQEGTALLTKISNDFNMKDWEFAGQLTEIYDQMPELREEIRNDILKDGAELHQMNFDNRLKLASLVLDDWYKRYGLAMASQELGFNQQIARGKLRLDQKELKAQVRKDKMEARKDIRAENRERKEENRIDMSASIDMGVWVNKRGEVVPPPRGYPAKPPPRWKPGGGGGGVGGAANTPEKRGALNEAKVTVAGITREELTVDEPYGPGRKRMSRGQARAYLYDAVAEDLAEAGYTPAQINKFVNSQLRAKGYKPPPKTNRRRRNVRNRGRRGAFGPGF